MQKNNNKQKTSSTKKKEKPILTEQEIKQKKARKTKLAAASFVLILAVGIMGNWYYQNSDLSANIQPLIESKETKTLGEAEFVGATTETKESSENSYFVSARMNRQNARDEALEKLQKVVESSEEGTGAKEEAAKNVARLSDNIEIENKIETLVTAKGVNNCIAVVSSEGERADIIIDSKELSDELIMQIKDIAMQQLGCSFEDVSIIQSK